MGFDAGRIEATSHLDNTPFRQGLVELRRLGKEAERNKVNIPVGLDTKKAEADVIDFKTRVKRTAGKTSVELVLENAAATRKLVTFSGRLDAMRAKVATARVDADTDAAKTRLDALDIQLRRIGLITSRPKVSVEGVERANLQLDALALKLAAINRGGGGGVGGAGGRGGFFGAIGRAGSHAPGFGALAIGAAAPLVAPAAGLALGAGASLLTPTLAGGLGLGIFGAAAKSSVTTVTKDVSQLEKLTQRYNAATTNKQRAAVLQKEAALWKSLDPAQRQAVKNVQGLEESWKRFQKRLEPQSFAALAGGAKLANTGLNFLLPTAQAVGDEIAILEAKAQHAFRAPFWHQFFGDFLPGEAARSVDTFGTALGHMLSGGAHLMQDFAPLGHDLENVIVRLTGKFDAWTQGQGPVRFVNWVEANGPQAASALEALAHGLEGVGVGLGPIARVELTALTPVLNFIGDLGKSHPEVITAVGTALLVVGGGLKAIQAAKGLGGVAGTIKGLFGGGGGPGGLRGGTPATPLYVLDVSGGGGLPGGGKPGGKGGPGSLAKLLPFAGRALPFTLPLLTSGDQANAANPPLSTRHNAAAQLFATAGKDFPSYLYQNNKLNVPDAAGYLAQTGNPAQVAQLQALAKTYPQIAQGIKAAAVSENTLNRYLAQNTGLAAAAGAQDARLARQIRGAFAGLPAWIRDAQQAAQAGGFVIGTNLDKGIILGIQQGSGKVAIESVKMTKGALIASKNTAIVSSPSKVTTYYGRMIAEGLAVGFAQQMPQVQALFAKHTAAALGKIRTLAQSRLDSARQQLTADQQNAAGLSSSIAGGMLGAADISGAINPAGGTNSISGFLGGVGSTETRLLADLQRLKGKVNPAILLQIAQQPPTQALGLAESILLGNSGPIGTINRDYASVVKTSNQIGSLVGGAVSGPQIAADRQLVVALQTLVKALAHQPDVVVKINDREIARAARTGSAKLARAHS